MGQLFVGHTLEGAGEFGDLADDCIDTDSVTSMWIVHGKKFQEYLVPLDHKNLNLKEMNHISEEPKMSKVSPSFSL
uniref:PLAT domain-containing protein n=1 Tax=Steinernema glaseri TaxID=37863 RepID=A0A1I7ZQQ9_9BILA